MNLSILKSNAFSPFLKKRAVGGLTLFCMLFFALSMPMRVYSENTQQGILLSGTITDTTGEGLIGVTVTVKGTNTITISSRNGSYSITVPNKNAVLVFTYIGFATQEIPVGDSKVINLVMQDATMDIDEVVVVGYGVQKKVNLTSAVSQVSGSEIVSKASTDVLNALQGQMSGVTVLRSSGQPGSEASSIRIRGFSSANDAGALILIDGVEGDIKMLNPEDVESISVLKDAASASIYGARAAGGVVLITTKKGVAGAKAKISYSGSFGFNLPGNMPKRMSSWEEQELINLSRVNNTGAPEQTPEQVSWIGNPNYNYRPNGLRWDFFSSTNWLNEGTKDFTTQQNHSVSINGGSESVRYYVSSGYYTKNGLIKYGADDYSRYNLRATVDAKLNNYADLNLNVNYDGGFTTQSSYGSTSLLSLLYTSRGRQGIWLPDEDTNYENNPYSADLQLNAIDIMKNGGEDKVRNEMFTGKVNLHLHNFVKGLTFDLNASRRADYYNREIDKRFIISMGKNGEVRGGGTGTYSANNPNAVEKTKNYAYLDKFEGLVNYDLKLNKHAVHLLGGASYEQYYKDQIRAVGRNLLSNDFFSLNYFDKSVATNTVVEDVIQPWKIASLFARANYNFAERYLLEANIRYDGSSRLASGNRWGAFPSAALAWRVSEEAFFEPVKPYVNNFKLRGSWGKLGNSTVLNSMYYPYYGLIENSTIMGKGSYYQAEMASQDITWEEVTSEDLGIDLGFLDNRLNLTADYYWKYNSNMLSVVEASHLVGVSVPYQNIGELKTWGWEIAVNWRDKIGNVSYQIGFNIDDSQNELVKFAADDLIKADDSVTHLTGYPLNTLWGYKTDGFWKSRDEYLEYKAAHPGYESFNDAKVTGGDIRYVAQGNPDHAIGAGSGTVDDHGDLVYMGSSNSRYLYGVNLAMQWKGFDFSMFFQGVGKRAFFIEPSTLAPIGYSYNMPWTIHRDYWTEDNQNAYFARMLDGGTGFNSKYDYWYSDHWIQNGAYIRLKNVQLGYTLPIAKTILQTCRIYVTGTDVWESTNVLSVFDPEVGNNKSSSYYPFFRTWTVGLNITF
jgi:TonB-linked SusC/RagA family outer membrane protein